jgi:glutamate/tyrosine decarboxylase-like PLP-dependent enzyme
MTQHEGTELLEIEKGDLTRMTSDVVALCEAYRTGLQTSPVWKKQEHSVLDRLVKAGIPDEPVSWTDTKEILQHIILGSQAHLAHPRFLAFVPSPNNVVSCLGDFLASAYNPFAGSWLEGSGAQTVERVVTDWLASELGFPTGSGGIFLSGGSISNLTALVTARQAQFGTGDWRRGTIYFSDQAHSSIVRALRILGFGTDQIRAIPADAGFRLPVEALISAIKSDKASGRVPFCVVATAGTTNTGAPDPLPDLSRICLEERIWLHVDGAYGGAAALCAEGRAILPGLGLADSVTLDPHKWLFQPYACSCLLVRDATQLRRAFRMQAEYLEEAEGDWNLWDYSPELTRPFRGLKLWLSLQVFGAGAFRRAISKGIRLAQLAESLVREMPGWQLVTAASLGVVTFRFVGRVEDEATLNEINEAIAQRCLADGFAFVVTTRLRGRAVLRFCTINPRTTETDISETLSRLDRFGWEIGTHQVE